jgi:hypothetical protein
LVLLIFEVRCYPFGPVLVHAGQSPNQHDDLGTRASLHAFITAGAHHRTPASQHERIKARLHQGMSASTCRDRQGRKNNKGQQL